METVLTKTFHFSASFSRQDKVFGHNYALDVTLPAPDPLAETRITAAVEKELIGKLQSRDLGTDVPFLAGVEITDSNLLAAFRPLLEKCLSPLPLLSLGLRRDGRTLTTWTP